MLWITYVFSYAKLQNRTELRENMCAVNKKEKYSFVQSNKKSMLILYI